MREDNIKYLLGIDGGGTKTEFLLTDIFGNIIKRLQLGSSNPVNIGTENTFNVLNEGILKICKNFDRTEISVFAGLAGANTGNNCKLINEFLSGFRFGRFACSSDVELALELALNDSDGTVIIMGTGIIAFSRKDKKLYRTGGWGYMIDKGGSGYCFGSAALNAAFEFFDGRDKNKTIAEIIERKLNKSLTEAVPDIYKGGPSYVASFAPAVFDAYKLGDPVASDIIKKNAKETAKIINTALSYAESCNKKAFICGGLCNQKEILYPFIKKHLEYDTEIMFIDEPMVNAAISLAKKLLGEQLC